MSNIEAIFKVIQLFLNRHCDYRLFNYLVDELVCNYLFPVQVNGVLQCCIEGLPLLNEHAGNIQSLLMLFIDCCCVNMAVRLVFTSRILKQSSSDMSISLSLLFIDL